MKAPKQGPGSGLRVALIYTRVSSDDQAREGVSLDAQLKECRAYAGRQPDWVLGSEYQDVMSGKKDDRPGYQAMLGEARRLRGEGRKVAIVVAALDRLGRRIIERVTSREAMKDLGVPLHSTREGGEVNDLMANMLAVMAQDEIDRLGRRVSASLLHLHSLGWRTGGKIPWGYRWRPTTDAERHTGAGKRALEVDPATAPYVVEAFRRAAEGASIHSVASWAAALPSEARGGRDLSYAAMRLILATTTYIARVDNAEGEPLGRPMGHWPALVADDTWAAVRARIALHGRVPRQATGSYLLTGFARCELCGARMAGFRPKRGSLQYRCNARASGANTAVPRCARIAMMVEADRAVCAEVGRLLDSAMAPEVRAELNRAWGAITVGDAASHPKDTRAKLLTATIEKAKERLKRATLLLTDGIIKKDAYDLLAAQVEADLAAATAELASMGEAPTPAPALPPLDDVLSALDGWTGIEVGAADEVMHRRALLGILIDQAVPVREGYGRYGVRVRWTQVGQALADSAAMAWAEYLAAQVPPEVVTPVVEAEVIELPKAEEEADAA